MKKYILFIVITLGVFIQIISCNSGREKQRKINPNVPRAFNENNKKIPYVSIDYSQLKKIKIPKLANYHQAIDLPIDNVKFIKLETDTNCLIGEIANIFFDDDKIIIIDKGVAQSVFIFDLKGNFKAKIFKKGKGPQEFLEIRDAAIDKLNKRIVILDLQGRKLCFYNYEGQFLFNKKMKYFYSSLRLLDSVNIVADAQTAYNFLYPSINNHYLVLGNIDGDAISKAFPYDENARDFSFFNSKHVVDFNSKIYYYPRYSDTIFEATKNKLQARYVIDFQGNGFPVNDKVNMTDKKFMKITKLYPYFGGNFVELKDFLYLTLNYPIYYMNLFYDKHSGNIKINNVENIIRFEDCFFGKPITCFSDNTLVSVCNPSNIITLRPTFKTMPKDVQKNTSKEFKNLLNSIKEDDNPVIFMYKLKSF